MEDYSVQVPSYTVGPEAYRQIEKQCHIYGKKAVVVGGKKAMAAAKDKLLAAVKDTGIEILDFVWFGGECTFNNAKKLEQLEAVRQADMIFAVGGGKAIDTCKLVSIDFEKPYFSFPTIASNCAPTSAVSIVYNEDGTFCKFVHFLEPAKHVFINTEIIANAPKEYLWAGIGDSYAKCMEARGEHGAQALKDNEQGVASYALEQVALDIIITAGWVSLLVAREHTMDYNGGVAHAFFYGLCNLPGFDEDHLHGVVVGFGVLLLLTIDGKEEECQKLIAFNKTVGLPAKLSEVGVTVEEVAKCAPFMVKDEDLEHYPYVVTEEMIVEAAKKLDY